MFCPRCATTINEQLKFCRSCGLPVGQVSSFVASGGTLELRGTVGEQTQLAAPSFTPGHILALTVMAIISAPAVVGVLTKILDLPGKFAAIPAVLIPFLVTWAVMRYRAQMQRSGGSREQTKQIVHPPLAHALPPPETNPLNSMQPASVVEDETIRLPRER